MWCRKCVLLEVARNRGRCGICDRQNVSEPESFVEDFSEMQVQLQRKKRLRAELQERCEAILKKKERAEKLRKDVDACKERITLLKSISSRCKDNFISNRAKARDLTRENKLRSDRLPVYEGKVNKIDGLVQGSNSKLESSRRELQALQQLIKSVVHRRAEQLLKFIFPITEFIPQCKSEHSDGMEKIPFEIAEASQMTFVRGQWVGSDSSGEVHHCIVAPILPTSGDYSAYNMWIATNKDGIHGAGVSTDKIELNSAYSITAALTYTAQLVNVLAFYLDVRLPKKQHYSDFCKAEMTDQQFARRVARLNANVLHLCFSQNIPPSVLHPTRTLHNVLQLFNKDVSDLGRQGYVEVDTDLISSLEDQLIRDLEAFEGDDDETCSDGDDGDCLPGGWESVPSLPYQETGAGALTDSRALVSAHGSVVNTSVAGGLVTSAAATLASFWRGWTAGGNR